MGDNWGTGDKRDNGDIRDNQDEEDTGGKGDTGNNGDNRDMGQRGHRGQWGQPRARAGDREVTDWPLLSRFSWGDNGDTGDIIALGAGEGTVGDRR